MSAGAQVPTSAGATAGKPIDQHNVEIEQNLRAWQRKPVLQRAYRDFHRRIASHVDPSIPGKIVELGSGIGNIRASPR